MCLYAVIPIKNPAYSEMAGLIQGAVLYEQIPEPSEYRHSRYSFFWRKYT